MINFQACIFGRSDARLPPDLILGNHVVVL
nr:MAG TPA: hypothetical protein [Caudoviricetes sp.]